MSVHPSIAAVHRERVDWMWWARVDWGERRVERVDSGDRLNEVRRDGYSKERRVKVKWNVTWEWCLGVVVEGGGVVVVKDTSSVEVDCQADEDGEVGDWGMAVISAS